MIKFFEAGWSNDADIRSGITPITPNCPAPKRSFYVNPIHVISIFPHTDAPFTTSLIRLVDVANAIWIMGHPDWVADQIKV